MSKQNGTTINYMIVEKCIGDLERLFISLSKDLSLGVIIEKDFDNIFNSIFMQLSITLKILSLIFFNNFYHQDLGPRNVLYIIDDSKNTYFTYKILDKTFNVQNVGYIPKLWDFSHVYIDDTEFLLNTGNFTYLEDDELDTTHKEKIPNLVQLCVQMKNMSCYELISKTETYKNIEEISQLNKDDWNLYFDIFDTYIPSS